MTIPTQIRIDANIKPKASALFESMGLDMSSAVNLFLYQCVLKGCIPFNIEVPNYNKETLDAMVEAKQIANDPNVPGYKTMDELTKALEDN